MRERSLVSDISWWRIGYWWGVAVLVTVLFMGLDSVGWMNWWRSGVERVLVPIDTRLLIIGSRIQTPFTWVQAGRKASERIAGLEDRLATTAVDAAYLKELEARVATMEQMSVVTGAGKRADRIVPLLNYGERLLVGVGSQDGVTEGRIVTDSHGVLLGKLAHVGLYLSQVATVSQVGTRVAVVTLSGKTQGIVEGRGTQGQAELLEVLQTDPLVVGDVVVTSGKDGQYPPGLVVGQVSQLTGSSEQVTKGAVISLLSNTTEWGALW